MVIQFTVGMAITNNAREIPQAAPEFLCILDRKVVQRVEIRQRDSPALFQRIPKRGEIGGANLRL